MLSVYVSFALVGIISWWSKKYPGILVIGYSVVFASVLFFLITNAAVWWFSPWYEHNLTGLLYSYELGLPFFRNMLLGDVVYTFTLLGALSVLSHFAAPRKRDWGYTDPGHLGTHTRPVRLDS